MIVRAVALAALSAFLPIASLHADERDGRLDMYWIDVEGGAATLLVTPAGETLLIDSGNPGRRDPDRIVQVVGKIAGKSRVDHLVTTHYHGDHYGGAVELSALLPIGTVYDNGVWDEMPEQPVEFQVR
jgi:glyoxylase-like metal-dependent hydrolase (beta-lactamase superfamily II)